MTKTHGHTRPPFFLSRPRLKHREIHKSIIHQDTSHDDTLVYNLL